MHCRYIASSPGSLLPGDEVTTAGVLTVLPLELSESYGDLCNNQLCNCNYVSYKSCDILGYMSLCLSVHIHNYTGICTCTPVPQQL